LSLEVNTLKLIARELLDSKRVLISMLKTLARMILWLAISVLLATAYGILNDQITVTISPEYFSVFKRHMFWWLVSGLVEHGAPLRIQAAAVGAAATWWYGAFLAVILIPFALLGRRPQLSTRQYLNAILLIMAITLGMSVVFGLIAYIDVPHPVYGPGNEFLYGIIDTHHAFAVGWWHNGAYLGALIGTIFTCCVVVKWRLALSKNH
jgi:hypothetical protein